MIRLLINKLGDGHNDLFLKIDVMVNHVQVADSYFLFDFLEISHRAYKALPDGEGDRLKYGARKLIEFWYERKKKTEREQKTFIPFDLSDQYIGGLQLERIQLGFRAQFVFTDEIVGSEVGISNLDNLIGERKIEFQASEDNEWIIGEETLYNGLEWSLKELPIK